MSNVQSPIHPIISSSTPIHSCTFPCLYPTNHPILPPTKQPTTYPPTRYRPNIQTPFDHSSIPSSPNHPHSLSRFHLSSHPSNHPAMLLSTVTACARTHLPDHPTTYPSSVHSSSSFTQPYFHPSIHPLFLLLNHSHLPTYQPCIHPPSYAFSTHLSSIFRCLYVFSLYFGKSSNVVFKHLQHLLCAEHDFKWCTNIG